MKLSEIEEVVSEQRNNMLNNHC